MRSDFSLKKHIFPLTAGGCSEGLQIDAFRFFFKEAIFRGTFNMPTSYQ